MRVDTSPETLKTDLRFYTYAGEILLVADRLYQGQTTNMRTPGGGFAPVFQIEEEAEPVPAVPVVN